MRLLLDTNIFLEVILDQEKTKEVGKLLSQVEEHEFFMTDFSLHSIGVLLIRRKQHDILRQFINDTILNIGTTVISIYPEDIEAVIDVTQKFNLDFDDAYQYVAAKKSNLVFVSFDSDFDRTEIKRETPSSLVKA